MLGCSDGWLFVVCLRCLVVGLVKCDLLIARYGNSVVMLELTFVSILLVIL